MSRKQVIELIENLAMSQGFYWRLRNGNYGDFDLIVDSIMSVVQPKTDLDVILALEG